MNKLNRDWLLSACVGQQGAGLEASVADSAAAVVAERCRRKIFRFGRPAAWMMALAALSLAGCGGDDESVAAEASASTSAIAGVTDEQLDAAVARTQDRVKAALKAQGIGSETKKGGYAVGGEHDGESVSIGVDLDTPAWLPARFPLPEDLSISMVTTDKQGHSELRGSSSVATQSAIAERASQWAVENGWEVVRSTDVMLTLADSDSQVIDLRVDDGVDLELRLSRRDLAEERQQSALERKGSGSAEVTMEGDTRTVQGDCVIKGNSYQFEYSAPDGSVFASVQIQNANSAASGSATFMTNGQGGFEQFTINFPMYNDSEPVVTASGDTFAVNGTFASMGGGSLSAVDGSVSVRCNF